MVNVSESLPVFAPEVFAEHGLLPTEPDMKRRSLDGPGGLIKQHAFDAGAAAPYVLLDQSALDGPQNGQVFLQDHGHHAQGPFTPLTPSNFGYQGMQLNPNQPAFMPGLQHQHQQQTLGSGYNANGEMMYQGDNPSPPGFGTSPTGYMEVTTGFGHPGAFAPQHSPMTPPASYPGTPVPQQVFSAGAMPGMVHPYVNPYASGPYATNNIANVGRTVYVGNLPSTASVDELLNLVRFGPIESVRILPEKSCAFISFLDPTVAAAFHSDMLTRHVQLHNQDLRIGWGKNVPMYTHVMHAVQVYGATRNVYLGNLDEDVTEQSLRDDLSRFGPIDQVKIVRDKSIGFVHFLSIANAIEVVQALPQEPEWLGKRVNFGKDRCAYVPKNQHQQQAHNLAAAQMAASYTGGFGMNQGFGIVTDPENIGNRTVYLGNLHPDTTVEEVCNAVRGGILQQVRYIPTKHICFVTFVDPNAALAFYTMSVAQGISIHQRRLKIGWGKHSGPPPPGISMVVQAGGSRNIYIGNIADFDEFSVERLRSDFGVHGDIELVNLLREKNCAFVNFTQINFAIKALEAIKQDPAYANLKVAYGKDRCGSLKPYTGERLRPNRRSPASSTGPPATPSPPIEGANGQSQNFASLHVNAVTAGAAMPMPAAPTQVLASA